MTFLDRKLDTEISKYNKSLLAQVQIFSDTYLIEKINLIVTEKFFDITKDGNIQDFFSNYSFESTAVFQRIYSNISNITLNNDFIDSVYIYRKNDDTLITSGEKVTFNATSPQNVYKGLMNIELINKTMLNEGGQNWFSPLENNQFWNTKPVLSFCQSIPMYTTQKDRLGCFIININEERFFQTLNKISDSNNGEIVVMDSKGRILADSKYKKRFDTGFRDLLSKSIGTAGDGVVLSEVDGKKVAIAWVKSSLNDWRYISVTPLETVNRTKFLARQFSILAIGLLTILSLLGLNFITRWMYKPLNTIIKSVKAQFDVEEGDSDLSLINDVISNLSTKVVEMEDTLLRNSGLILNKIASDVLYGNVETLEGINKRLQLTGKSFHYKQFCIAVTEVDPNLFQQMTLEQREFVTYMVVDLINGYFGKLCDSITVSQSSSTFTSILSLNNYDEVRKNLNGLILSLKIELGLNYNIAISDVLTDLKKSGETYNTTRKYLEYSFIHGYGNVFTYDLINGFESNNRDFDINLLKDMEILFRSLKFTQLKEEIGAIRKDTKMGAYSFSYVQSTLLNIIGLICRISHEQGVNTEKLHKNKIMNEFSGIKSIDDCFDWICGLIDTYDSNVNIRNNNIDSTFIEKIKNYIDVNIDKQISLSIVAEKFNMSLSYISRIFRDGTGTNFSDYVLIKKIEKAAELLMTERKADVSEIAERLGYFNLSYFSKLFKERYGITPLQYRKKNIE